MCQSGLSGELTYFGPDSSGGSRRARERDRPAARVREREDQASRHAIHGPAATTPRDAGLVELAVGEALLARSGDDLLLVGRVAELEALRHLPRHAALVQIGARALRQRALAQDAMVEGGGQRQQLAPPVLPAPPGRDLRAQLLVFERDVEAVGQPLDGAHEVERVARLDIGDRVAADPAAVAVVELLGRVDVERRRALVVERAAADPLGARLAQLRVGARELDDVGPLAHLLERGRGQAAAHGPAWASGSSSSSKRRSA